MRRSRPYRRLFRLEDSGGSEAEVREELAHHIELTAQELMDGGMDPAQARQEAERRFGSVEGYQRVCTRYERRNRRSERGREVLESLLQDIRFGFRTMRRRSGLSLAIIFTLAIGIGASSGVFSAVHGVLLAPLPYPEPEGLVRMYSRFLPESGMVRDRFTLSPAAVIDYRESTSVLESVGYFFYSRATLTGGEAAPQRVSGVRMSADLLPTLDVRPLLGRWFNEGEDALGGPQVAILDHDLWISRFGGDPGILGRSIVVNSVSTEVIGVMPQGFEVLPGGNAGIFLPSRLNEEAPGERGANYYLNAIGRLGPGHSLDQASSELESLIRGWRAEYGNPRQGETFFLVGLHEDTVRGVSRILWTLLTAVVLVLLIGSANVMNLLLAQGEKRGPEVSLRASMGAGRGRIARQFLTESTILAVIGGVLGVGLAALGIAGLRFIDPSALPRMEEIRISIPVLGFTALVTLGTTLLAGLIPALRAGGEERSTRLASSNRSTGGVAFRRLRFFLIAGQVALSVVVVVGAGLVARSLSELLHVDTGLETDGRLTFGFGFSPEDYPTSEERISFVERFQKGLESIPGVTEAGFTSNLPLSGSMWFEDPEVLGRPAAREGDSNPIAIAFLVSPGYLEAMGIGVVRGQGLSQADPDGSPPVALVNEEAARVFWDGDDPVGSRVRLRYPGAEDRPWITVTGILEDTRPQGLRVDPFPQFFFLNSQSLLTTGSARGSGYFVVGTLGDPLSLIPGIRRVAAELDSNLPLTDLRTMDDLVRSATARSRFSTGLLAAFGLSALILALVGVYGVVSYSVARRVKEAGVRIALGAEGGQVVSLMVREGMRPALLGVGLGLLGSFLTAGLLEDLVFQISPTAPKTFLGLAPVLTFVAWLACWIPARRCSRIAPMEALRRE